MCGIAGFINTNNNSINEIDTISKGIVSSLRHRGPDSQGYWIDHKLGLSICHTRLSIIDLNTTGAQPMHSKSGRFVISYNGEIYNSDSIKKKLNDSGIIFKGTSDTEVILEACEYWGIKNAINKTIGMFSFALWDKKLCKLYLVRDRIGIKPLYYGKQNGIFYFSSELKPIKDNLKLNFSINKYALKKFCEYSYIATPDSIFNNIYKLEPGHILEIDLKLNISKKKYWNMKDYVGKKNLHSSNFSNLKSQITSLIEDSVKKRMISDVPIGCFLSGGIDSSLVASIMQKNSNKKINTFTIGFEENNYNEAIQAKNISKYLGTNHNEHYFSNKDALEVIPNIYKFYDEPFADSSQIPTVLLSSFTSSKVKVALSGDGGDEFFRGYNRYYWAENFSKINKFSPEIIRSFLSKLINRIPENSIEYLASTKVISKKIPNLKNKLYKIADILSLKTNDEIYEYLIKNNNKVDSIINFNEGDFNVFKKYENILFKNFNHKMQFLDANYYLPDDILTKVDRASMAHGLEVRVPFTDHRIAQLMISNSITSTSITKNKLILKKILNGYVPKKLFDRPKMGFGVPLSNWLRGSLKVWAQDLINSSEVKGNEFLNYENINMLLNEHIEYKRDNSYKLWPILVFISWLNNNSYA